MTGLSISNAARIDVGQLPSIPRVLLKLIEASHKVDVSFKELAGIIQQKYGVAKDEAERQLDEFAANH